MVCLELIFYVAGTADPSQNLCLEGDGSGGALGKIEEGGRVFLKVWDFSFVNKIKGRIQSSNPKLTKNIFFLLVSFKMVFLSRLFENLAVLYSIVYFIYFVCLSIRWIIRFSESVSLHSKNKYIKYFYFETVFAVTRQKMCLRRMRFSSNCGLGF